MLSEKNTSRAKLFGIKGRSFLAFAVLTIFTLLASILGSNSYKRIESELERVVQVNMHSLKLMSDLKEFGSSITIRAPTLLLAEDESSQKQVWDELNLNVEAMQNLVPKDQTELFSKIKSLNVPLDKLNKNISAQLKIKKDKEVFDEKLRWQTASFLSEIDTSIENSKRHWQESYKQAYPQGYPQKNKNTKYTFDPNLEVLYRVKADFNLLANLIDRVQHLPDLSSLIAIRIHSREIIQSLNKDLRSLHQQPDYLNLRQSVTELMLLAQGKNNIFSIRRNERDIKETGALQLTQIRQELSSLNELLGKQSALAELAAQEAAQNVQATIKNGRILSIFLVGGSLLFSISMVWLYIGQNIVARITSLNTSMRSISNGNLAQEVLVDGSDEIGAMARSLVSFRDQLETLQEELVQSGKLAALGQLSAGISHEINQPLSAIRHYTHNSSRLIQKGRLKEAEENLTHINLLTKRIIATTSQLRTLAKGEQDTSVLMDVKQAIDNAMLTLVGHKTLEGTHLQIHIPENIKQAYADPIQLEQVIVNLISNALDAVEDNDEKHIDISCYQHADSLEIQVNDNGKGIPKELKNQVFDTFFTTKKRGQNLGLGLSISYNMVKNFGGKLSVNADSESGASFSIQLPLFKQGKHERTE